MTEPIPFTGRAIRDILADIHAAPHPQAIGAEFERLFRHAAPRIPELDVKNIWRWADWPAREEHTGLDAMDYGVDAVAELHDGDLVAVQCKCYAEDHRVSSDDVRDFIVGANKFKSRWIVAVNEYAGHAEKLIKSNGISIIDFREYLDLKFKDAKPEPREPWQLQQEAIDAVLRGFAESGRDRGRLIMACGTGKTFTALRIAEQLAPHENAGILFIAPSIALVAQARREWLRHTARPLACTVICSDSGAGRNRDEDISHTEISCRVTTDPEAIAAQLKQPVARGGARAVFCTYQSLKKLRDAQHKHGAPAFALALVDEAHRTTGYLDGDRAGLFQLIHKQDEIRAEKRLYMTATPRVYEIRESRREEDRARVVDMNDDETYGREFYRLSFRKAVDAGMLCNYRVIALGISEAAMTGALSGRLLELNVEGAGRAADEQAILALGAIALAVNGAVRGENQPGVLARTIAYASNIRRSKWLASALKDEEVKSWITGAKSYGGNGDGAARAALPIHTEHLDGNSSALNRNRALRALNHDAAADAPRLISNAKLFTEGIDVPALNAIAFLDPKQSKVDTIQAVGRVMRRDDASGKQLGYIVVPVILPPNAELLQVLEEDRARFKSLGSVLSALQSHDERLSTELTERLTFATIERDPSEYDSERVPPEDYQVQMSLLDEDAKQEIFAQIAKNTGLANRGKIIADAITVAIEKAARVFVNEGATKTIAEVIGTPGDNEAESCKTAALLIANACIMHKRLEETDNLDGLTRIEFANRAEDLTKAWRAILAKDYAPIFHDATALLEQLPKNPRMENAIGDLIQCAIDNAAELNEIGFDHAGPLYHKVLGSAQSDGAFYTKNLSAYLLAGLAFGGDFTDWSDAARVKALRVVDPACGTGTLLMAALNIIKKRAAAAQKLDARGEQELHKQLVENVMHGFDINRYSVQLAACNLTIGAPQTDYARMNLHALQHGPAPGKDGARVDDVRHGALELLLDDDVLGIKQPPPPLYGDNPMRETKELPMPEKFDTVIYNPPFTDTSRQGDRFNKQTKKAMRDRLSWMKEMLETSDPAAAASIAKRSIQPYFTPLTKRLLPVGGTLAKVIPATFCTSENARAQRHYIATNFHVVMVITSHDPKVINFSENTKIHECLLVARRRDSGQDAPARFIQLARFPRNVQQADELLAAIDSGDAGELYREMLWDAGKMRDGDWTPVQWFNSDLVDANANIVANENLLLADDVCAMSHTDVSFATNFDYGAKDKSGAFDAVNDGNAFCTIAADVMQTIQSKPEKKAVPKKGKERKAEKIWRKASRILITAHFSTTSTRLMAVYSQTPALGSQYIAITLNRPEHEKAYVAFLNSSFGVIQMLNRRSKKLTYPRYEVRALKTLLLPDPARADLAPLLQAFDAVKDIPLGRLAECARDPSRKILDHAAARAIGMDPAVTDQWREWLAMEPTITNKLAEI